MQTAALQPSFSATLRDLMELAKPRITLMVAITAAGGMRLAPGDVEPLRAAVMLLTTCMVVAGANALNCYLERDSDRLMQRTARRPLPDGRMQPRLALVFGLVLGLVSVPVLTLAINPLTGALGAIALVSYVAIYTPMKQYTPTALLVGAVPGALPPLMGWTAVTNGLEAPGLVLFSILFLWQVPHFIAISIFRQEEYERAGLKVLPSVKGLRTSKLQALLWTGVLFITSLLLVPLRVAGLGYAITALVMGAMFLAVAFMGLRESAGVKWAKQLFVTSLIYLTVLFTALMLDAA